MDLSTVYLVCLVLLVAVLVVAVSFRAGKGSVAGELHEAQQALRLYREYMRMKNSASLEAVEGFSERIDAKMSSISRRDYDALSMNAAALVGALKARAEMKAPTSSRQVR